MVTEETRVLCVGNEMVRDDGVGVRVGRLLSKLPLPDQVKVVVAPVVGLDLIELIQFAGRLVLVDATHSGQEPGTLSVWNAATVESFAQPPCCCHLVGLPELLRLARTLDAGRVPREVMLIGVEAADVTHFGTDLTPRVRAAIPKALAAALSALQANPTLLQLGRELALREASWDPDPITAYGG